MWRTTRVFTGSVVVATLLLAGCAAGAGRVVPAELEAPPSPPNVTIPPALRSGEAADHGSGTSPTTTQSATATTARTATPADAAAVELTPGDDATPVTDGAPDQLGPRFGPGLGVAVGTAPSVRTRGDTRQLLPDGLWVHLAWEPDPADASVFTPQPDDIEILEAYANAQLAYYRAALGASAPDAPELDRYFVDGTTRFAAAFAARAGAGQRLWLGSGVVLRPYVLADQRSATTAVVLDCYLHDEQELPIGTSPSSGPLRPAALVATMVVVDGRWMLDRTGTEPGICL